ncbi:unnamed protein product [Rotaria sp. Silwood2]|nr:unnamed protein product [Rotaria sp. Silwood2]
MPFCLTGTPIDVNIYDIQRISINAEHSQPVVVRTTVAYKVNTSQAGQGQLKVELIQPQSSKNPCRCHIQELKLHEYFIQYVPIEPGRYQLRVLFNNQLVQGKTLDTDVYLSLPQTSKTNTSSSIAHIQQIIPNNIPEIGDHICLQNNPL